MHNSELAKWVHCILVVPLVPPEYIEEAWEVVLAREVEVRVYFNPTATEAGNPPVSFSLLNRKLFEPALLNLFTFPRHSLRTFFIFYFHFIFTLWSAQRRQSIFIQFFLYAFGLISGFPTFPAVEGITDS